ncbi:MAG: phosphate ABC transporter substrate-binding protein [Theionarchaea archaeon]|nr:phosphate ABC transporter substrate-binding protein [Theionarchaea archaeon]
MEKNKALLVVIIIVIIIAYDWLSSDEIQSLSITGSTTVLPLAQLAAEKYMDMHSTVNILVGTSGSSVGVKAAGEGTVDIGMASRDMRDSEKRDYPDLKTIVIARDGIALIVHPSNPVTSLTVEDIKKIYEGSYTDWSELGGDNTEIVVIGRDSASGTREFFWGFVMKKGDFVKSMLEKNSNGAVRQTVAQTPGAIGYVGLGYIDETVKAVKIEVNGKEVEPTGATVQSGLYPLSRSLYFLVKGEPQGLIKDFIDFVLSAEGQEIVKEEGFVPIKELNCNFWFFIFEKFNNVTYSCMQRLVTCL